MVGVILARTETTCRRWLPKWLEVKSF